MLSLRRKRSRIIAAIASVAVGLAVVAVLFGQRDLGVSLQTTGIADTLAAWGAVAAALIAAVALLVESRRSRFALGVELLLKMDERFSSPEMIGLRRKAAVSLQAKAYDDVEEILDFFEMIGLLVRKGALDEEMVWNTFSYWIHRYFQCAKSHIEEARQIDRTTWENLVDLNRMILVTEARERARFGQPFDANLPNEKVQQFLGDEATLQ